MLRVISVACVVFILCAGCKSNKIPNNSGIVTDNAPSNFNIPGFEPTYLENSDPLNCGCDDPFYSNSMSPDDMIDYANIAYMPISLQECIVAALQHSEVFRNASGTIVSAPSAIGTALDAAITYTDPQFGEEAALSAFDANFISSAFFENNDRPFNNSFSGNSFGLFKQDLIEVRTEINKLSATGTQFNARSSVIYDGNNQAGNRFPQSYQAILDFGFRHPLLQGSGSLFNRIAGPSQTPGVYNGVLIARTNTEISLTDFQTSVRNLVSDVENAYWDLYFAYRELDAQVESRDKAQSHLAELKSRQSTLPNQDTIEQASAREQLLRFETAIVDSLEGRNVEGTTSFSGNSGGAFRRNVGVRTAERRLRYLMGMAITDGQLLQPSDIPTSAPIRFDWNESVCQAVSFRPETRRQRWVIKQRELELTAARNFLLPRLDLVGNYRFRGLGRNLTGGGTLQEDIASPPQDLSSAYSDLLGGDFQEVQFGAEYRLPVGYRQGHAAVRNAQLSVQREKARLKEQHEKIVLDLSNTLSDVRRSYSAMVVSQERHAAAQKYYKIAEERFIQNRIQIDVLLEAQRRILEAQLQYISAEAEYAIAIKNVHFEKGTFLRFHGVDFAESVSSHLAYNDFNRRNFGKRPMNYFIRENAIGTHAASAQCDCESCRGLIEQAMPIDNTVNITDMSEVPDQAPESMSSQPETSGIIEPVESNIGDLFNLSDAPNADAEGIQSPNQE